MDLYIGTINGYNNLIVIATPDEIKSIQLGKNNVNNAPVILQETFETPPDDFVDEPVVTQETPEDKTVILQGKVYQVKKTHTHTQLTHDETKLDITLSGIIGGPF